METGFINFGFKDSQNSGKFNTTEQIKKLSFWNVIFQFQYIDFIKNWLINATGVLCILISFNIQIQAQYTKIFDFTDTTGYEPYGSVIIDGNELFGTTSNGGPGNSHKGVIFKINADGANYTRLLDLNNDNGYDCRGSLLLSNKMLYGMTKMGGNHFIDGLIFKIALDGTDFSKLFDFNDTLGRGSECALNLLDNTLFGWAYDDNFGNGFIFKINTNGSDFLKLFQFDGINGSVSAGNYHSNSIIISNNILFGMTSMGGEKDRGIVYKINKDGTNFTKLLDFDGSNGAYPNGSLILLGNVLYGTTTGFGQSAGVIFKIKTDGTEYTKLFDFRNTLNGAVPAGSLIIIGNSLYGMTNQGGSFNSGVIFKINTDGTGFQVLYNFDGLNGSKPFGSLSLSGNTLYGMTKLGGANNKGVIFKYDLTQVSVIQQTYSNNFRVYPNPTKDYLSIESDANIFNVIITDILGKILIQGKGENGTLILDISSFKNDIYFISASSRSNRETFKLLKN